VALPTLASRAYSAALALSDSALIASFLSDISEFKLSVRVPSAAMALFYSAVILSEIASSAVVALLVSVAILDESLDSSDLALLTSVLSKFLMESSASDLLLASYYSAAFALLISLLRLLEISFSAFSALVYSY
jgi:hypothetical protein